MNFQSEHQFRTYFEDHLNQFGVKEIKLRQRFCPDYVCVMTDGSIKRIEAELDAESFCRHSHNLGKVDLIISAFSQKRDIHGIPVLALEYGKQMPLSSYLPKNYEGICFHLTRDNFLDLKYVVQLHSSKGEFIFREVYGKKKRGHLYSCAIFDSHVQQSDFMIHSDMWYRHYGATWFTHGSHIRHISEKTPMKITRIGNYSQ